MNNDYTLMVSDDCGINYYKEKSGSHEELLNIGKRKDIENPYAQRWNIKDSNGNDTDDLCNMHSSILNTLKEIRR